MKILLITILIVALAAGGYIAWYYWKSHQPKLGEIEYSGQGTIDSINGNEIVVDAPLLNSKGEVDGSEKKKIIVSNETEYNFLDMNKTPFEVVKAQASDLKVGQTIIIYSTGKIGGSATAYKIDILK